MKKIVSNPHDRFFRMAMSYPRVSQQFLETYLPKELRQQINLDTLQSEKESYIDEALRLSMTDMLYSVEMSAQKGYIYILVEHQSKADPLMPFRLMKYIFLIMEDHLKKHNTEELPFIYPVVLYNGKKAYRHTTDIFKLFGHHEDLARRVFLKPFQLVDLSQIPDKVLSQQAWLSVLLMCLKHTIDRDDVLHWIEPVMDNMCTVENEGGFELIKASFNYLLHSGKISDYSQFSEIAHDHLTPKLEETMMTIAQVLKAKGRQEGMQEGEARGMLKAKQEMVEKLLQKKFMPMESIAEITGVSIEAMQLLSKQKNISKSS